MFLFLITWPPDMKITLHICQFMANIMVDNVTKIFSTHLIFCQHFFKHFAIAWSHGMKITILIPVYLWLLLWFITLLTIFLRIAILYTFLDRMVICHANDTSHFCRSMADRVVDNVTKDFSHI